MTPLRIRLSRAVPALAMLLALAGAAGCDNPFKPRIGYAPIAVEPPPRPSSPQGLMNLFRWCWENRSIAEYEELFTDDFRFVFPDVVAANNPPILRDEEVAIARRIFVDGSASEPRAKRIEMTFVNQPLIPIADTRPNKPDPWHKLVQTRVRLTVELSDPTPIQIDGDVNFFVVRGDSALIPDELQQRGFTPNPGRWYIERWEDKTGSNVIAVLRSVARARATGRPVMAAELRRVAGLSAGATASPPGLRFRPAAPVRASVIAPPVASTWEELVRRFRE